MPVRDVTEEMIQSVVNRRKFLAGTAAAGLGAAAVALTGCSGGMTAAAQTPATADTATQIFTAALIAEDLAITTYWAARFRI
jgi:secreted PhoX family phosphatase